MCIDALDKNSFGLDSGGSSVKFLESQNAVKVAVLVLRARTLMFALQSAVTFEILL